MAKRTSRYAMNTDSTISSNDTSHITPVFTGEPWESSEKHIRMDFREPGFNHIVFDGTPSADEMRSAILQIIAFAQSHSRPAILVDMCRLADFPLELRKLARQTTGNKMPPTTIAVVGASFHLRVITTLLIKAIRLMKTDKSGPFAFVATEEEGWIWLKEQIAKAQA